LTESWLSVTIDIPLKHITVYSDERKDLRNEFFPDCDFVQTSPCGRGEYHPRGLVGKLWRIKDPETVRVGHCFLQGRLKSGDLFLCINHSGDNFQDYIFIEKYSNGYRGRPQWEFGI